MGALLLQQLMLWATTCHVHSDSWGFGQNPRQYFTAARVGGADGRCGSEWGPTVAVLAHLAVLAPAAALASCVRPLPQVEMPSLMPSLAGPAKAAPGAGSGGGYVKKTGCPLMRRQPAGR